MRRALVILGIALAMAATGCGGSNSGGSTSDTETPRIADAANGERLYKGTCITCHGADATGIAGLGKTLVGSVFVNGVSDADLVEFLTVGRPATDPLNTTGVDMLPRGGNPSLDDDDLLDIVAFIRSLN